MDPRPKIRLFNLALYEKTQIILNIDSPILVLPLALIMFLNCITDFPEIHTSAEVRVKLDGKK